MEAAARFALGKRPALDGLRALAIALVVLYHGQVALRVRGGFLGVEMFFVLSGFLITYLLVEERERFGRVSLANFYARRALRLLPALVVLLLALFVYLHAAGPATRLHSFDREGPAALFYVDNWYRAFNWGPSDLLAHTWSLSVEEQFYIVWPALLLTAVRLRGYGLAFALALSGAAASAIFRGMAWSGEGTLIRLFTGTDSRGDALLIGCALALAIASGKIHPHRLGRNFAALALPAIAALAIISGRVPWNSGFLYRGGYTLYSLLVAVLILALLSPATPRLRRLFEWRPAVLLGKVSYGLYLWHFPVFALVADRVSGNVACEAIELPLALALTALSYRLVERPALRLKERFEPGRSFRRFTAPAPTAG